MPNLAQITIAGHIGSDAETKNVKDTTVTEFSVAVNDRQDNTAWYRVAVWGKYGTVLQPMLTKGAIVMVIGDFAPREYTTQAGEARMSLDVTGRHVIVAGSGHAGGSNNNAPQDDNIPF